MFTSRTISVSMSIVFLVMGAYANAQESSAFMAFGASANSKEIVESLDDRTEVVGIDEGQFFDNTPVALMILGNVFDGHISTADLGQATNVEARVG